MTDLRTAAAEYLAMRRALGFKLERAEGLLNSFIDHLQARQAATITIELALEWATLPQQASAWWWSQRLGVVRGFARYLQAIDPANEVPPAGLIDAVVPRATPYMFAESDIAALMAAAQGLDPPSRAATYDTVIGLLAVTGMRISEAINLDDGDVDLDDAVIVVRNSKFGKTRELVLHQSVVEALGSYRRKRQHHRPSPASAAFFVSTVGTRLHYCNVIAVFHRLTDQAGIQAGRNKRRPTPHDFRHRFAVTTVVDWYAAGVDIGPRLAALSTYLGHANPANTYWYLSATPELLSLAAQRLETFLGVQP
ncbi:MAG: tyrosine-type recombinase/integrase [Actinomycetota bacterium]|nr:tyrosine-type recombinase/integrase [Actinomycetota bacterium]MDQ6949171.1 tyrosine-type recombinase/integrase [Actinomycetota bacterium]